MATTQQDGQTTPDTQTVMNIFADVQASGLGSLTWLGTRWVETLGELGSEWLTFVADRVREDVRTQHELLHAKTPTDIQQIQAKFLERAMEDYRVETGKVIRMCSEAMADIRAKAATEDQL